LSTTCRADWLRTTLSSTRIVRSSTGSPGDKI
jgi:hypothetical protein